MIGAIFRSGSSYGKLRPDQKTFDEEGIEIPFPQRVVDMVPAAPPES